MSNLGIHFSLVSFFHVTIRRLSGHSQVTFQSWIGHLAAAEGYVFRHPQPLFRPGSVINIHVLHGVIRNFTDSVRCSADGQIQAFEWYSGSKSVLIVSEFWPACHRDVSIAS